MSLLRKEYMLINVENYHSIATFYILVYIIYIIRSSYFYIIFVKFGKKNNVIIDYIALFYYFSNDSTLMAGQSLNRLSKSKYCLVSFVNT